MNLLEFLDARHARKVAYRRSLPYRPFDAKLLAGSLFLFGYYAVVIVLSQIAVPSENGDLVRDSLLVLGPAVGVIVGALFRSDRRDEESTRNTGEAFRAVTATAHAGGGLDGHRPTGTPDDPVHVQEEPKL